MLQQGESIEITLSFLFYLLCNYLIEALWLERRQKGSLVVFFVCFHFTFSKKCSRLSLWHINMYYGMAPSNLPGNTHISPFKDLVKLNTFGGKNIAMVSIMLKEDDVPKLVPTTDAQSCPTWE